MLRILMFTVAIAGAAAIAHAACDPHPMQHAMLRPSDSTMLGSASCELRAETATTATLTCDARVIHLTWEAP